MSARSTCYLRSLHLGRVHRVDRRRLNAVVESVVRWYGWRVAHQEDGLLERELLRTTLDDARAESNDTGLRVSRQRTPSIKSRFTYHLNGTAERHLALGSYDLSIYVH